MSLPKIDDQFEHYRILSQLGEGGMAQVFLAEDLKLSRKVALKFLGTENLKPNPTLLKRFENEAKTLASLNHPNIINIYDFGTSGDLSYLAMEYVKGDTLSKIIQKKAFGIKDSLKTIEQIVAGMGAAHQKGILHRDIKPANILIDDNKKIKLVDFGIAKSLQRDDGNLTQVDHFIGTINYTAPEILSGYPPSPSSDIFSIGVLFYELITGMHPFLGQNKFETMEKLKFSEVRLPSDLEALLPVSLKNLMLKLLAKERKDRYQTATEILPDIAATFDDLHPDLHQISIRPDLVVTNREEIRLQLLKKGYQESEIRLIIHQAAQLEDMAQVLGPDTGDCTIDTSTFDIKNKIEISAMNLNASINSFENSKTKIAQTQTRKIDSKNIHSKTSDNNTENFYSHESIESSIPFPLYKPNFFKKAFVFIGFLIVAGGAFLQINKSDVQVIEFVNNFKQYFQEKKDQPQQRQISSVPSVPLAGPPTGSQFTFHHIQTRGDRQSTVFDTKVLVKVKRSANGIISINQKNINTGKWSQVRWSYNVTAPPIRIYEKNGRNEKVVLSPEHNSIYPLNIGRKGSFTYKVIKHDSSFLVGQSDCEVTDHINQTIQGKAQSLFIIQCQINYDGSLRHSTIQYSPDLKIVVSRVTRWKKNGVPYYELWELE